MTPPVSKSKALTKFKTYLSKLKLISNFEVDEVREVSYLDIPSVKLRIYSSSRKARNYDILSYKNIVCKSNMPLVKCVYYVGVCSGRFSVESPAKSKFKSKMRK